jgi:tripartite-type tricarboxylate transporter receptor subunit TctC
MARHLGWRWARHSALILACVVLFAPLAAMAQNMAQNLAQDWPSKQPIKIIVPFSAGSATDIIARTVFTQVGSQIGQTFVIENRGGAGTTLGSAMVARADPDGYTLLVNSTSHVVVASTYANLPYSVADDFAGLSELADMPFIVAAATRYNTLADLIAAGKKPGSHILYGTAGAGSSGQLFMERLRLAAGFPATNVPFRGTPEGMDEVVAGRIDLYPAPALNALPLASAGKVHALAISATKRLALMPDVPTLAEEGLPNALYNFWIGAFAPAKTPKPIVDRLNHEVAIALLRKDIAEKIRNLGGEPTPETAVAFDAFVRKEIAVNAEIVKASGYKPQ